MSREKTWPGFAAVVKNSPHTSDHIMRWFGITEDTFLTWCSSGAPIPVHIALRAIQDLGMISVEFSGWRLENGWLIAPNNRKISLRRLENIAQVQADHALRLVK